MRLFFSDTFLEAVIKLPKMIQDKVLAFQRKFRENPALPGIHLEPISSFKDTALRTARVDDNYRAIVGVLDGSNYTLLYVADHEEAYRWGMSKRFIWNEHTQSCQIINVEESTDSELPTEKIVEPTLFAQTAQDRCSSRLDWESYFYSIHK